MSDAPDSVLPRSGTPPRPRARESPRNGPSPGNKGHRMKIIALTISLACVSQAALADDLATPTPSPTPAIYHPLRNGTIWRQEQIARRNQQQTAADSRAHERAKQKADRAGGQAAQTQARQAARTREQAEREVAAENRRESRNQKPTLTSDLMSRMGFSEKEVADQKAREQSASGDSRKTTDPATPGQ